MIKILNIIMNKIINVILFIILFISIYCIYDLFPIYEEIKDSQELKIFNPIIYNKYNNDNIIGWIKINDTIIDYPILQGSNNTDYLTLNYKNEYSVSGSIFLDYRNNKNFNDDFNIIYGHNMSYLSMFSEIKYFKDKSYLNAHKNGILYLKDATYSINIILYKEVNENDDIPYNLYLYKNNNNNKIYYSLTNKSGNIKKILILSTCKKGNRNKRVILLCELNKI